MLAGMLNSLVRTLAPAAAVVAALTTPSAPALKADAPLVQLKPVPFTSVTIQDNFWSPRRETNRTASIPVNFQMLERSGNIRNLELAGAHETNGFTGPVFMDSDLYKALEAAAYSLATHPDPALEAQMDRIIALLAAAQLPNGYLDTYFEVKEPNAKWTNLRDWHELYCAGHLFEAAVAHYQATGKRHLLNVAIKLADHIDATFGSAPGKRMGYPGHPEIELALVKLSRATGEKRYFDLARFFVENRGIKFFATEHNTSLNDYDGTYWQDDVPICDHKNIKGHAVRACYLLSGATDVAAETRNPALLRMLDRVWRNTTERNMYLTGGIGPSASNEGFTVDYDLPNLSAYQETCASVALALWNHRMGLLYGDSRYADVYERSLYNGVLAGVSLDGTRFFYVNPLASVGGHHRSPWFGCACCPPNVARTLSSLGGYVYATSDKALWINLYLQGGVKTEVAGVPVEMQVRTDYPWDGRIALTLKPASPATFQLRLRLPGWCKSSTLAVNKKPQPSPVMEKGYLVIDRTWKPGDTAVLDLAMPVERIQAHPGVREDAGQLALQRGPLVYCVEQVDMDAPLDQIYLPVENALKAVRQPSLLGGVVTLEGQAASVEPATWSKRLYQTTPTPRSVRFSAIPYYAWDNRKAGAMRVWLPTAPAPQPIAGIEAAATVSMSFANDNCSPSGINDGKEVKSSHDHPGAMCHWWPHKGSEEWAQYTWKQPLLVAGARVYWFDDTGSGECRLPGSWAMEYLDGQTWRPVKAASDYAVKMDGWCDVSFAPVTTTALRLKVKLQPNWAAGVQEWQVVEADE